jgi:hypothetical protein
MVFFSLSFNFDKSKSRQISIRKGMIARLFMNEAATPMKKKMNWYGLNILKNIGFISIIKMKVYWLIG